ncbi:methyl-accepting chemotaxis protein [Lutibacter sp. B2]|nr:methyl-accepting chemotaxis protein [Lutibacter sp. B2]
MKRVMKWISMKKGTMGKVLFRWKDISIGYKYGMGMLVILTLFIVAICITINSFSNIEKNIEKLEATDKKLIKITQMGSLFREKDINIGEFIQFKKDRYINEYEDTRRKILILSDEIKPIMNTDQLKIYYKYIKTSDEKVEKTFKKEIISSVKMNKEKKIMNARIIISATKNSTIEVLETMSKLVSKECELAVKNANASIKKGIYTLLISVIISIILGSLATYIIARQVRKYLEQVIKISDQVAQGDLTVNKIHYDGKDEIGQLASSINKMIDNFRRIINELATVSEEVNKQSESFTNIAEEVRGGSEQIAETMQQMAIGAEEQADSSTEISHKVNELSIIIEESNNHGKELKERSESVLAVTEVGNKLILASVDQMDVINNVVKESVEKVKNLDEKSKNISTLIDVINSISKQTNLLALNAAIEAARAGEAGRGFAVVADEIRKLAEQVGNSASEIRRIIEAIQKDTNLVAEALEIGYGEVESGRIQISDTEKSFVKIDKEVRQMAGNIQQLSKNLSKVVDHSVEISTSIEQVAAIAEENSASIEQTSALAQQENSSMDLMKNKNGDMIHSIERLKTYINNFKI